MVSFPFFPSLVESLDFSLKFLFLVLDFDEFSECGGLLDFGAEELLELELECDGL